MKPIFIRDNEINLRKAKLQSELISELCEMVDMVRAGKVTADMVVNNWHALQEIYNLKEFFTIFEKQLNDIFNTAMTPDCIEY